MKSLKAYKRLKRRRVAGEIKCVAYTSELCRPLPCPFLLVLKLQVHHSRLSVIMCGDSALVSLKRTHAHVSQQTPVVNHSDLNTSWSRGEESERYPLPRNRHRQQRHPQPNASVSTNSSEQFTLATVVPSSTRLHPLFTLSPSESPSNSPRTRTTPDPARRRWFTTHPLRKLYGLSLDAADSTPKKTRRSPTLQT